MKSSSRDAFFDTDFSYSENLWYAFGVTAYDSNPEPIEDPSIGVVKAYFKTWGGLAGDDVQGVHFKELPVRNCSEAELQINGKSDPNSKFFKPHKNSERDLAFYYRKLKCLDIPKVEVQGDYNSPRTRSLALTFEKCNNSTFSGTCQSD